MPQPLLTLRRRAIRQTAQQQVQQQQRVTAALKELQRTAGLNPQQLLRSRKPMGIHSKVQRLHSPQTRSCSSLQMQV